MNANILRTPEERFGVLPGFPYEPHYVDRLPGYESMRLAYIDEGPRRISAVRLRVGAPRSSAVDPDLAHRRLSHCAGIATLAITAQAQPLAGSLVGSGLSPAKAAADALHVGIAAANGVDYLLTWNIRHFAKAAMHRRIEDACRVAGFAAPVLCTPEELMEG
jgi:hypothetical protein